jgi:hypothetical protein
MKATPLARLVNRARKNQKFSELLKSDPRAALKEAEKQGIVLSAKEAKVLKAVLSGRRVSLTFSLANLVESLEITEAGNRRVIRMHLPLWDIGCGTLTYSKGPKPRKPKLFGSRPKPYGSQSYARRAAKKR